MSASPDSRQKAIEAVIEKLPLGDLPATRTGWATEIVDAILPHLQPDPLTEPTWVGDAHHPDWADYLATNLLDALGLVPDTGDWHGALRWWCERTKTGRLKPNREAGASLPATVTEEMVDRALAASRPADPERPGSRDWMHAILEAALCPTEPEEKRCS